MIKGRDVWWEDEIHKGGNHGKPIFRPKKWMRKTLCLFYILPVHRQTKRRGAHLWRLYGLTTYTFVNVFQYKPGEVHFCTADIGWITGHSYIVYGP